ncbi:unnamed protein product [marine sediment metagenome]|uniref:HEPN domain-containing protein n=1 Tax=marine sediment metagenome TaxID=412755 RepID=X1LRL9_9ZZZZ
MNIPEAIEILTDERKDHHDFPTDVIGQAEQLAIEALNRIRTLRQDPRLSPAAPLPSETEE